MAVDWDSLREEVAAFYKWGRDDAAWSSEQEAELASIVVAGVQQFYMPPPLDTSGKNHDWSFFHPVGSLDTVADTSAYDLPSDFAAIEGPLTFDAREAFHVVPVVGEGRVRQAQQHGPPAGKPQIAAVRPKSSNGGTAAVAYEMVMAPTPDAVYALSFRYTVIPPDIGAVKTVPYGNSLYPQAIVESCLAVAENRMEDRGQVHQGLFLQHLAAAVSRDRRATTPDYFGYNADRSDSRGGVTRRPGDRYVTYNDTLYD